MSSCSDSRAVSGRSLIPWVIAAVVLAHGCGGGSSPSDVAGDTAGPDVDSGPMVPCQDQKDCLDFVVDSCQVAVCSVDSGQCEAVTDKALDGTDCQPEDLCSDGTCEDGKCLESPRCDDQNACPDDACAPLTGECTHTDTVCDDENPCTTDGCDTATGCTMEPDIGLACNDNDSCTTTDLCDASGDCVGKDPKDCDDDNPCTDDGCDPVTGDCTHGDNTAPCEDGDPCTTGDSCTGSICVPGLNVPGCCHSGPDCDDKDPCTEEDCVDGACQYMGESPGDTETGCVPGSACQSGFCNMATGTCDTFDLTMPRGLLDWDLTEGTAPAGFRWTTAGGVMGPKGTGGPTGEPGSFRLPSHFAPAGIKVLHLHLAQGGNCGTEATAVTVGGVQVTSSGCVPGEGAPVVSYSWTDPAADLVDVEITVQPDKVVSRVTYLAWAASGCRPLGQVAVAPGTDITDLALAGNLRGMVAGYRIGKDGYASSMSLLQGLQDPTKVNDSTFNPDAVWFRSSMVALEDGLYLFAYGGADKQVRLVLLDELGQVVSSGVPDLFAPQADDQYEPHLARLADGGAFLVYASSQVDGDGLGIARTGISIIGDQIGPFTAVEKVNVAVEGDQRRPVQWSESAGTPGLAAWVTSADQVVKARRLPLAATPDTEVVVAEAEGNVTFLDLALARSDDLFYLVWQTSDGSVGGTVLDGDLAPMGDVDLTGVGGEQYDPSLVVLTSGALLMVTRVDGLDVNVVQVRVSGDGAVTNVVKVSDQVEKPTASPILAACGPFMACFGFVDTWNPADKGLYLGYTSTACDEGPVDCTKPSAPGVCVGFGSPAYVTFPGATGWCP